MASGTKLFRGIVASFKPTAFSQRFGFSTLQKLELSSKCLVSSLTDSTKSKCHPCCSNTFCRYQSVISHRKYHAESDQVFSSVLLDEIKAEKERMVDIPEIPGWKLKRSGADCKLTKKLNQESITVSFNVNASIPPGTSEDPDEEQEMVSQPDFTVEFTKPSLGESLSFACYFPEEPVDDDVGDAEDLEPFRIRSVILHKGEIAESTYIIDTDNIDFSYSENMMTYMKERGINNDFINHLVDLATIVESREYMFSLEKLEKFVSSK